jgi:hypothetical protein
MELPITSPTMRAHLAKPWSGLSLSNRMACMMRRWTGFSPSRTSGSAVHDGRQRIGEVALFQRLSDRPAQCCRRRHLEAAKAFFP